MTNWVGRIGADDLEPGTWLHLVEVYQFSQEHSPTLSEGDQLLITFPNGRRRTATVEWLSDEEALIQMPDGEGWRLTPPGSNDGRPPFDTVGRDFEDWVFREQVAASAD